MAVETRNYLGFLIMGTINNFFCITINSSNQSLCAHFHKENFVGVVLWCNITFGIVARIVHLFFLEKTSFMGRIVAKIFLDFIGLSLLVISTSLGDGYFWLCLLGIVFVGTSGSFGETVTLCYLKLYSSELMGAWSSGTGFSGFLGSLVYTLLITPWVDFDNRTIFLVISPLVIVYALVFFFLLKRPSREAEIAALKGESKNADNNNEGDDDETDENSENEGSDIPSVIKSESIRINSETTPILPQKENDTAGKRFKRCVKFVWWRWLNITLVYLFQYVASTGGSDRAQGGDYKHDSNWFIRNSFVVLNLMYQFGTLLSRSSLSLFKVKYIEIITVLQFINFVFWLIQGAIHFIQGYPIIWILFIHMFYVGLVGGFSYVNGFYLVLHDEKIPQKDREFCMSLTSFSGSFGIIASSLFVIILDNTLWKRGGGGGVSSFSFSSSS